MGAEVFIAEMVPSRLAKAIEFGAHHAVDLSQAEDPASRVELLKDCTGGGADVVIDLTGVPDVFSDSVQATRNGGIMVEIGNITPHKYTQFDPGLFTRTGVQVRAAIRYPQAVLGKAIHFVADTPQFAWEELVDAEFSLDEAATALTKAANREVTRAGLIVDDSGS